MTPLAGLCFVYAQQGLSGNEQRQPFKAHTKDLHLPTLDFFIFFLHFQIGTKDALFNVYATSLAKWDKGDLSPAQKETLAS